MVKRTASEANIDDDCLVAIHYNGSTMNEKRMSEDRMMESPVPPMLRHEYSVDPVTRVRAIPKLNVEECNPSKDPIDKTTNHEEDGDMEDVSTVFTPIIAPIARRVVSPELIFHSATESLMRNRQRSTDYSFRPIVADRPDLEITSPPLRAANPVIMDSRFQHFDLKQGAPLQPFRPRAYRRFQSPSSPFS